MAIVLRADTGSALTHNQVDTNFTSFYYSASLSGSTLTFFRTGSTVLGITRTSSSFNIASDTYWTASAGNISRLGTVIASGSFINGHNSTAPGTFGHAQGLSTQAGGNYSHAEGYLTQATGLYSHAEGNGSSAIGTGSHAEGNSTQARGIYSHAEGYLTVATGSYSHAEGVASQAIGTYSHAEGNANIATGVASHAEGLTTEAVGEGSHAEGVATIASGYGAHAEGFNTVASGSYSHAEGEGTTASGSYSHAEGFETIALGTHSHAEGDSSISSGNYSHAEGYLTIASGDFSHAEGNNTVALGDYQHVQGQFNISSSAQSAFIIGNGTATGGRRNLVFASGSIFEITGSFRVSGSISGSYIGIIESSSFAATASFVNNLRQDVTITGSLTVSPDALLPGSSSAYFGTKALASTSSFAIFRDSVGRLSIGNNVGATGYGADGIKIDTEGKVQLNHVIQNYGIYDTTLNIIGSGSNDGITMMQWPDTTNRYRITIQSGSQSKMNFRNILSPSSGSFDFSGSVAISNDLFLGGNKQFNYGMFFHTASIAVANGSSGSVLLSTTTTANGVSIVSGSRITVENPGYYNIQFSAQLSQGSGAANYYLWFKKNGSNIANSNSIKTLSTGTNELMTVDIIDHASTAGDYYEIAHQSDNTNSTILYSAASGNIPATPAIIVTVQQVR